MVKIKLSEEEQWAVRERYELYKQLTKEANALSNDDICRMVQIPPGELRNILQGKKVPHLGPKRNQALNMVSKRDQKRSLASAHKPEALTREFNLTMDELRAIVL